MPSFTPAGKPEYVPFHSERHSGYGTKSAAHHSTAQHRTATAQQSTRVAFNHTYTSLSTTHNSTETHTTGAIGRHNLYPAPGISDFIINACDQQIRAGFGSECWCSTRQSAGRWMGHRRKAKPSLATTVYSHQHPNH